GTSSGRVAVGQLEQGSPGGVRQARLNDLLILESQLAGDLTDLRLLVRRNRLVRRGHREQTIEQFAPLFISRDLPKDASDEKIFGAAKQPVLVLRDRHDQYGLIVGQMAETLDDLDHLVGLRLADLQVGRGHAAEYVGKCGQISGAGLVQLLELACDAADGVRVVSVGARAAVETETIEYGHAAVQCF